MRKKTKGIIIICFGFYLSVINTIMSILLNRVKPSVNPSPSDEWMNWWVNFGLSTLIAAGAGVFLIIGGCYYLIKIKRLTQL